MLSILTSVLDMVGMLLLVASVVVLVLAWSLPGALAAAGLGVLAVSWLANRRGGR